MNDCAYPCEFHRGKIEWHHPIAEEGEVGVYLCEAHHSLVQGRKVRYRGEMIVNKTLDEMRAELKEMEREAVEAKGKRLSDINKH